MPRGDDPLVRELRLAELRHALASHDPRARAAGLSNAPLDQDALGMCIAALEDEEPVVRREAVRALARMGGGRASREIMRVASSDLAPVVRTEAIAALGRELARRTAHRQGSVDR